MIDVGGGLCQTAGLYEGHLIPSTVNNMHLGGFDLDNYMMSFHQSPGHYALTSTSDRQIAANIKEQHCYVAQDYEKEHESGRRCEESLDIGLLLHLNYGVVQSPRGAIPAVPDQQLLPRSPPICI